jgi:hypothetical protein
MTNTSPDSNSLPRLRWYQFRLRSLLLLAVVVALVAGAWTSQETLRCNEFCRGNDWVISTSRFEIVVREAKMNGRSGCGSMQVGGIGWASGHETAQINGEVCFESSHDYSWGTLRYEINGAKFSLYDHARQVTANGRVYSISHMAIITIDQQGGITVEDQLPEGKSG